MRASLRSLLLLVALLLVGRAATAQLLSPGPLAAPHASLEGDENCGRCHTSGRGTSNGLCNGCHGSVTKQGLHARAFGGPCAKCHSDHRGRGFALVRFSPNGFDHGQTGWPLQGKHGSTKCAKCHKPGTWQNVSRACKSCHKDPHDNRFGANCLGCHNDKSPTYKKFCFYERLEQIRHNLPGHDHANDLVCGCGDACACDHGNEEGCAVKRSEKK